MQVPLGLRTDILVADIVILEIKAVPVLRQAHAAQLLTSLRMSILPAGLLTSFQALRLKAGLKRFVAS